MVNGLGFRPRAHALGLAALMLAAGCGGSADQPQADRPEKASSSSATASPSPTSSSIPSPTPSSGLSTARPGRLFVVPADRFGRPCPVRRPAGVVCDRKRQAYRFQPQALRRVGVVRAEATVSTHGQAAWVVEVDLDAAGTRTLTRLTTRAAGTRELVLLMLRRTGPAITAAQVMTPIRGGQLQISGLDGEPEARSIVNQITRSAR